MRACTGGSSTAARSTQLASSLHPWHLHWVGMPDQATGSAPALGRQFLRTHEGANQMSVVVWGAIDFHIVNAYSNLLPLSAYCLVLSAQCVTYILLTLVLIRLHKLTSDCLTACSTYACHTEGAIPSAEAPRGQHAQSRRPSSSIVPGCLASLSPCGNFDVCTGCL